MENENFKECQRWKKQSDYDFELATSLISKEFSISCFLFQQAAEKSLISYLILKGTDKVW